MKRILLSLSLLCSGCAVHNPEPVDTSGLESPEWLTPDGHTAPDQWWTVFDLHDLDQYMQEVLAGNFDLKQAWRRLDQSAAAARIAGAARSPQLNGAASASRTDGETPFAIPGVESEDEEFRAGLSLGYEVDLWKRVASARKAGVLRREASREDVEATAMLLSGTATDLWIRMLELRAQKNLILTQIETSETQLELIEMRYKIGSAAALDIFQQRQQLAGVRAELPRVEAALATVKGQLNVLRGMDPGTPIPISGDDLPPELPPMPGLPALPELIDQRPDLRASLRRMLAAEHDVAVAVADRYPKLSLSVDTAFVSSTASTLFDSESTSIMADLFAPIVDGGARRAEAERRIALSEELLEAWNGQLLESLREIHDAVVQEAHLGTLLEEIQSSEKAARDTANEARQRYVRGLSDYLPVASAVQAQQQAERQLITQQAERLRNRVRLYRAAGGDWTRALKEDTK